MTKPICKKCDSKYCTKNGFVRGKQRYICKHCSTSFVLGDERGNIPLSVKLHGLKLYVSGLSMNRSAHILNVSTPAVLRWIKSFGEKLGERPQVEGDVIVLELDEMWHYVNSKKTNSGSAETALTKL